MEGYSYKARGAILVIEVDRDFTIDLLPTILREILHALWLDTSEKIETIKIVRTYRCTRR